MHHRRWNMEKKLRNRCPSSLRSYSRLLHIPAFFVETFAKLSLIDQHVLQDSLELETSFINVNAIAETSALTAIRMDLVAEMPNLRAMLDIRVFLSTGKGKWHSTRSQEMQKHSRYVTHADGRRCTNMKFYAAVVNTYEK